MSFKTTLENFNLGPDRKMILIHGVRTTKEDIEQTLNYLATKFPAEPVVLLLQDEEEQAGGGAARAAGASLSQNGSPCSDCQLDHLSGGNPDSFRSA